MAEEPEGNFLGNGVKLLGNVTQFLSVGVNIVVGTFIPGPGDLIAAGVMLLGGTMTTFGHILNGHFKSAANYAISTVADTAVMAVPYDFLIQGASMLTSGNTIGNHLANAIISPTQAPVDPKITYSPQAQAKLQAMQQQQQQNGGMLKAAGGVVAAAAAVGLTVLGVKGLKNTKMFSQLMSSGAAKKVEQAVIPELKVAGATLAKTGKEVAAKTPGFTKVQTTIAEVGKPLSEGVGQLANQAKTIASKTHEALPQTAKNLFETVRQGETKTAKIVAGTGAVVGGAVAGKTAQALGGTTTETVNLVEDPNVRAFGGAPAGHDSWAGYVKNRNGARTTVQAATATNGTPAGAIIGDQTMLLAEQRARDLQLAKAGGINA